MASVPPTQPDPRTAADDDTVPQHPAPVPAGGVSSEDPAEGGDDAPGEQPGSPQG